MKPENTDLTSLLGLNLTTAKGFSRKKKRKKERNNKKC